jgi:hypothetical protein
VATIAQRHGPFSAALMAEAVYELASQGSTSLDLNVRGEDVAGLVLSFKKMIGEAVDAGDFTHILSPERSFIMYVLPSMPSNCMLILCKCFSRQWRA